MSLGVLAIPGVANAGPNEGDIFSAVNAARASAGLPGYAYAGDLAAAARGQAERMAASGELYHNPNLGSEVGGWSRIGENVAFAGDWRAAHDVLMNSPDHRAQILDSGYTQMGVGTAVGDDGTIWVAEVFRTPTGAAPSSGGSGRHTELVDERTHDEHLVGIGHHRLRRGSRPPNSSSARASGRRARRWLTARSSARATTPSSPSSTSPRSWTPSPADHALGVELVTSPRCRAPARPPAVVAGEAAAERAETTQELHLDPQAAAFFDIDNTIVRGASLFHLARGLAKRKFFTMGDVQLVRLEAGQVPRRRA